MYILLEMYGIDNVIARRYLLSDAFVAIDNYKVTLFDKEQLPENVSENHIQFFFSVITAVHCLMTSLNSTVITLRLKLVCFALRWKLCNVPHYAPFFVLLQLSVSILYCYN